MIRAALTFFALLSAIPLATAAPKLAPASKVQEMWGDVGVMADANDDRCTVSLYEDKVEQGYKLTFYDDNNACAKAFPVMGKVVAWRVYTDGSMSFAAADGADLVTFRKGKGYKRFAVKKVDGIERIWSAQEVAE